MTPTAGSRPVVVGADGSEASLRAVEWAAAEARWRGCRLVVVHANFWRSGALRTPEFHEEAAREAGILTTAVERARKACPDLEVEGVAVEPPAGRALVQASADACLLVVGSRGRGPVQELLLGSVSRECVLHAQCSVLVVRDHLDLDQPDR